MVNLVELIQSKTDEYIHTYTKPLYVYIHYRKGRKRRWILYIYFYCELNFLKNIYRETNNFCALQLIFVLSYNI